MSAMARTQQRIAHRLGPRVAHSNRQGYTARSGDGERSIAWSGRLVPSRSNNLIHFPQIESRPCSSCASSRLCSRAIALMPVTVQTL